MAMLEQKVHKLAAIVERLEHRLDLNSDIFASSCGQLDVKNVVLQRIVGDLLVKKDIHMVVDGEGNHRVDFLAYMQEYAMCSIMADFAAWCGELHKKALEEEEPHFPGEEGAIVVGGEY
jgi:hypothetical protein